MNPTPRKIHELDAAGIPFGRMASKVASLLIGKSKASYEPRLDGGDAVVVTNVKFMKVTGDKMNQKVYRHHTMQPGNMKEALMKEVYAKNPGEILRHAVNGMLPKNRRRPTLMKRLTIK